MPSDGIPPLAGDGGDTPIPISALQHAVYCLRQAALIHLERMWAENRFTAEGHVMHMASAIPSERKMGSTRRVTSLSIDSKRLGIAGVADLVEFRSSENGEVPYPVEYKRGNAGNGARRLRQVAKACRDYGQRVQYSVFEIELEPAQWVKLKAELEAIIDPEHDSLRYYHLGANWRRRVEHVGTKPPPDLGGVLIV